MMFLTSQQVPSDVTDGGLPFAMPMDTMTNCSATMGLHDPMSTLQSYSLL